MENALRAAVREAPPEFWPRFRIALTYAWRHRRLLDLQDPQTFTELVQRRKLYDRNPMMPRRADKVAVKDFVGRTLGPEFVVPTLWAGTELPEREAWPRPFVAKTRHGCNQSVFVRDDVDWGGARAQLHEWAKTSYGGWLDEWLYTQIPRGILIEPHIGDPATLPVDYKVHVFNGHAEFVQVHLDRAGNHRWLLFDRDWRRVSSVTQDADPPQPHSLVTMLEAAETLAGGFDYVRVDLYEIARKPLFGEMTFYPGSGLDPFDPPSLDLALGALWRDGYLSPSNSPASCSTIVPPNWSASMIVTARA